MSRCEIDAISRYLDAELSLPQRRRLELHLATCADCRSELEALRRVDRVLQTWGARREPIPVDTERRVLADVPPQSTLASLLAFGRFMPAAVGSTMAALLVLVTVNLGMYAGSSAGSREPAGPPRSVLEQRSAPLVNARRVSAILGVRTPGQVTPPRRHGSFDIQ